MFTLMPLKQRGGEKQRMGSEKKQEDKEVKYIMRKLARNIL